MKSLSRKQFRTAAVLGAAFFTIGAALELGEFVPLSDDEKVLVEWQYQRAILPHGLLLGIFWYSILSFVTGLIGFVLFKGWGRSLLMFSNVLWLLSAPFSGWIIYIPVVTATTGVGSSILLGLLALSYFEPHAEFFDDRKPKHI